MFGSLGFVVLLVFAVRELELSPGLIGLALSIGAAGSLLAALTATRLSRRFGIGPTTIAASVLWGPATLFFAFAPVGNAAVTFLVAGMLVLTFSGVTYNIVQVSYRQAICPPRLQGRMNSVMRFIVWGTIPLGTLAGGALGTWIGLRETLVVSAVGGSLAALWIIFSPQRHLREMPEPIDDGGARARDRVGATVRACPSSPRSRRGCESSIHWSRPRRSSEPGPAHIATLKTIDPPLAELEGRRFAGSRRRGKNLLFPTDDDGSRPARASHERGAPSLPALRGRRGPSRRCSGSASPMPGSSCSPREAGRSARASGS